MKTLDGRNRSFSVPDDVGIICVCYTEDFCVIIVAVIDSYVYM